MYEERASKRAAMCDPRRGINFWDRQSFLTTIATGEAGIVPAVRKMHHNLIVSDFDANGGMIDNDDGSSFYERVCFILF